MFLTRFLFHHHSASPLSYSSSDAFPQRLTSFDGSLVGVCNISMGLRFWVEHGISGFTGVNPVPPSIRLSKLNMPVDGVLTEMPVMSATFFRAKKSDGFRLAGTLSDDGRFGFWLLANVGVFSWGMYGVVGVVMSNSCPESLKHQLKKTCKQRIKDLSEYFNLHVTFPLSRRFIFIVKLIQGLSFDLERQLVGVHRVVVVIVADDGCHEVGWTLERNDGCMNAHWQRLDEFSILRHAGLYVWRAFAITNNAVLLCLVLLNQFV